MSMNHPDPTSATVGEEEFRIPYSFEDLPMRLQIKLVCGSLAFLSLLAYLGLAFFADLDKDLHMRVLPVLQYVMLMFYFIAYLTFAQDIRTSGIIWSDYDFLEKKSRDRLEKKRNLVRDQMMKAASDAKHRAHAISQESVRAEQVESSRLGSCFGLGASEPPVAAPEMTRTRLQRSFSTDAGPFQSPSPWKPPRASSGRGGDDVRIEMEATPEFESGTTTCVDPVVPRDCRPVEAGCLLQ